MISICTAVHSTMHIIWNLDCKFEIYNLQFYLQNEIQTDIQVRAVFTCTHFVHLHLCLQICVLPISQLRISYKYPCRIQKEIFCRRKMQKHTPEITCEMSNSVVALHMAAWANCHSMTSVHITLIRPADRNVQLASAKFLTHGLQDFQGWAVNCVGNKVCHQNVTQLFQSELSSFPHVRHCISWCSQNPCLNIDQR